MSDANDALAGAGEPSNTSILDSFEPDEQETPAPVEAEREERSEEGSTADDDIVLDEDDDGGERDEKASKAKDEDFATLRDGTKVSNKDLKEAYENRANYERDRAALDAEKAEIQRASQRSTQQEQLFQAVIKRQMDSLPPEPDPQLARENPGEYLAQQQLRARAIGELQQAVNGYQQLQGEASERQAQEFARHIQTEQASLFEKMPDLRDPQKRETFHREMVEGAQHYGFSTEEIASASDHRLMLMIRDANAYRRAVANRDKAREKAKDAAPVVVPQSPGRRVSGAERAQAVTREQVQRLRQTGSAKDAEAFLSRFE